MHTVFLRAALALSLAMAPATAAEIKVISANALAAVIVDTKPRFEADTGHRLSVNVEPTGELLRRVLAGEVFDVIIAPREAMDNMERQGKVVPGTAVALTRVGFGLAVASDGPRPDISTPEALKNTLLAAKTVILTDPQSGGVSGVHFMEVLDKLGITEQMKDKLVPQPGGDLHARRVVLGTADLAAQAEHEIRCVRGATFLDYPAQFQRTLVFLGGVGKASTDPAAAKTYVSFLTGAGASSTFKAHCLIQSAG